MESESQESERFHFFGFRLPRLRQLWSRENELLVSEAEAEEPTNHKALESKILIGLFFRFCFLLRLLFSES